MCRHDPSVATTARSSHDPPVATTPPWSHDPPLATTETASYDRGRTTSTPSSRRAIVRAVSYVVRGGGAPVMDAAAASASEVGSATRSELAASLRRDRRDEGIRGGEQCQAYRDE